MGGRGSSFSPAPVKPSTPSGYTLSDVQAMDDKGMHDFLIDVDKTDIPAFLNTDIHLQKMAYALGLNDMPEIVSQKEFDDMTVNAPFGSSATILYRTVNDTSSMTADDICDMLTDGDVTYHGNGIHGDGLYFSNSLSGSKAYGHTNPKTVGAILNNKANVISESKLKNEYDAFVKNHPQTRKALGFARSKSTHDSMSQFALLRGYNVITSNQGGGETYYTVLDRSVLTMTRKRY